MKYGAEAASQCLRVCDSLCHFCLWSFFRRFSSGIIYKKIHMLTNCLLITIKAYTNQATHTHTWSIDCAWFVYYSAEFIFFIQSVYAFIFILNNDDCGLSFFKKVFFLCQLFVLCLLNEHFDNSFEFCLNFCFFSYKWMFNARIISFVSSPPILFFFARLNIHIFG